MLKELTSPMSGAPGTINAVEPEPAPHLAAGDRIARMNIELRRFIADRRRRSRQFDQQLASAHYRSLRANLMLSVLTRARSGTLTPNWRESLALRLPEQPSETTFSPGDQLAVREVAATAPAAWEPYSGASWRAALETWFDATNDTYDALEDGRAETQQAHRERVIEQRAAIGRLRTHLGWTQPDTRAVPPPDGSQHAAPRLHIEAWYRAGLAGGGEAVDWMGWLEGHTDPAAAPLAARLSDADVRRQLEHLPEYWNPPPRPAP